MRSLHIFGVGFIANGAMAAHVFYSHTPVWWPQLVISSVFYLIGIVMLARPAAPPVVVTAEDVPGDINVHITKDAHGTFTVAVNPKFKVHGFGSRMEATLWFTSHMLQTVYKYSKKEPVTGRYTGKEN